jgi:C4-dicarboxylate-specific signal transduction histidine kinase
MSQKIEVIVQDTGPGIAADIWPKLFEPFQTTKNRGFGLGLATSRSLLDAVSATLQADRPIPGGGAIFRIQFPVNVAARAL